jgi:hypothetical protein
LTDASLHSGGRVALVAEKLTVSGGHARIELRTVNVKLAVSGAGRALLAAGDGQSSATLTIANRAPLNVLGASSAVDRLSRTVVRISGWPSPWS